MKTFLKILYILLGVLLLAYTNHHVQAGDICETIYGCFALYIWFKYS